VRRRADVVRARVVNVARLSDGALLELKASTTICVVIPARNEQETIGEVVRGIRRALVEQVALVTKSW
jgi:glucosyl-3-phosphoglycerate synthase